jgi:SAM-dependent methyltransferase
VAACGLSAMDRSHVEAELARAPEYYAARLRQVALRGRRAVLDAGCGIGQWSAVLAEENHAVVALDPRLERLRVARLIARENGLENVRLVCASAEALPFRPGAFDAEICYGVLMFVRPRRTLGELARALGPGGVLYLIASGPAWYLLDFPRRSVALRSVWPLLWSVAYLARTLWRRLTAADLPYTCFTRRDLRRLLERAGLRPESIAAEGTLGRDGGGVAPAYRAGPGGVATVHEALARKEPVS